MKEAEEDHEIILQAMGRFLKVLSSQKLQSFFRGCHLQNEKMIDVDEKSHADVKK